MLFEAHVTGDSITWRQDIVAGKNSSHRKGPSILNKRFNITENDRIDTRVLFLRDKIRIAYAGQKWLHMELRFV